ncbi:hypothetical protein EAI_09073 [Harpegnathos saltator]|uniref:Uncharacterized protein n=1 Tax=Harpegnathos saltator TaxID=610380 RepID=E2C6I9_HARSA|nr:hypothetical protein EAI_09073 [Harpegnathos saltator]
MEHCRNARIERRSGQNELLPYPYRGIRDVILRNYGRKVREDNGVQPRERSMILLVWKLPRMPALNENSKGLRVAFAVATVKDDAISVLSFLLATNDDADDGEKDAMRTTGTTEVFNFVLLYKPLGLSLDIC